MRMNEDSEPRAWLSRLGFCLDLVLPSVAALIAAYFFVTTTVGLIKSYTPVPFWDMWDGYLNFYVRVSDGDYGAWWEKHNDHRIVFSRVFFWIDLEFLGGSAKYLIALNLVLATLIAGAFGLLAREVVESRSQRLVFALVALASCVGWIQWQNLAWAFQSQMFASNLLPILAALSLAQSGVARGGASFSWFVTACILGVCAAFTMKNGLAALPLLSALGISLGIGWRRAVVLAAAGILVIAIYLLATVAPESAPAAKSSTTAFVLANGVDVAQFFFRLIGAPIATLSSDRGTVSAVVGIAFCLSILTALAIGVRRRSITAAQWTSLMIVAYCLVTAAGISVSRIEFWGGDYAFTSRYTTNTISMWLAGALFLYPLIVTAVRSRRFASVVFFILPVAILPHQSAALSVDAEVRYARLVSALALELRIRDKEQIEQIFPSVDVALELSALPSERDLGVFANELLRDSSRLLGKRLEHQGIRCLGRLDEVVPVDGDPRFLKLRGWAVDPYRERRPSAWFILDSDRRVVGFAIGGFRSESIGGALGTQTIEGAGFLGYVQSNALESALLVKGRDANCEAGPLSAPALDTSRFFPSALSDANWARGIARNWGPALLVLTSTAKAKGLRAGRTLVFADGTSREISEVVEQGDLAIVRLRGALLDGDTLGYPSSISIRD